MEKTELDPSQTSTVKGQEAMCKQYHRGETDEITLKSSSVRVMYRSKLYISTRNKVPEIWYNLYPWTFLELCRMMPRKTSSNFEGDPDLKHKKSMYGKTKNGYCDTSFLLISVEIIMIP